MSKLQVAAVFATVSLAVGGSAAIGPVTDLYIVNNAISPDGFEREAVLAGPTPTGATFPGPIIKGNKGDNFQINVIDRLTNETMLKTTTIHWHGIFQHGTSYDDGAAFVSQCPIASGNSFLYDFDIPDQAGTYWYHSHLALQYCDGLRGPLIVYDPHDPHAWMYDVDNDGTVITLADWYHVPAAQVKIPPQSVSTLINGLGPNANGTGELSVITVQKGLRYRFRLISISCDPNFNFTIDGHSNLTVIEADGQNTQPLPVDSIQIYAAQRYSFVLNADQPVDNYWIRAVDTTAGGPVGMAILRYKGAPKENPTTNQTLPTNPLLERNLHPLTNPAAPGNPDIDGVDFPPLNLKFAFANGLFSVNGVSFIPPPVPVLLQILSGAQIAQDIMPVGSVYSLPLNKTIQISMAGGVIGGGHPLHLHGHVFSVIRSAGESTYNYVDPVRRDTVNIGGQGDNVTIRFVTDNPGPWFLHCHIDFHLNAGFAIVLAEDIPGIPSVNKPTPAWDRLCPIYSALPISDH